MSSGGFAAAAQLKDIVCKSVSSPPKCFLPVAARRCGAGGHGEEKEREIGQQTKRFSSFIIFIDES